MGGSAEVTESASAAGSPWDPDCGVVCDVLDEPASEGEGGVAEPDHQEDQDDEVLVAAGGWCDGGCCVEEED